MRYKKLAGMDAGHVYVMTAPYAEISTPMRWMLHCEMAADEKIVADENELADARRWQPLTQALAWPAPPKGRIDWDGGGPRDIKLKYSTFFSMVAASATMES